MVLNFCTMVTTCCLHGSIIDARVPAVESYLTWLSRTEQANHFVENTYENPAEFWHRTPSNDDRPLDTDSMRTTSFLARFDLQVAVNASPFRQIHFAEGFPTDIVGLSLSNGHLYSRPENDFGVLLFYRDRSVRISDAPDTYERVEQAVGGFGNRQQPNRV